MLIGNLFSHAIWQTILEALRRDPILPQVSEMRLELPYGFT